MDYMRRILWFELIIRLQRSTFNAPKYASLAHILCTRPSGHINIVNRQIPWDQQIPTVAHTHVTSVNPEIMLSSYPTTDPIIDIFWDKSRRPVSSK